MGALYMYAGIEGLCRDNGKPWRTEDFCCRLIKEHVVAVTRGADFGTRRADAQVRFAFTTSVREIVLGLEHLAKAFLR